MELFAAFDSDGYKLGHAEMYANCTTKVYSNLTPRSDKIHRTKSTRYYDGKLIWIGGQGATREIYEKWQRFFAMPKAEAVAEFTEYVDMYLGEGVVPSFRLAQLHDLGYLPLEIKTLDEGTKVPMGVPVLTITNTVGHAFWLVNFLETLTSSLTWKTPTNCTIAGEYKAMLKDFAVRTGCDLAGVMFQAHDFSARGMSGPEDAARSGLAHIAHFLGTDTLSAIQYARKYYGATGFVAASVPATEHAVSSNNILSIEQALLAGEYEFHTDEQRAIFNEMRKDGHVLRLIAEAMFMYTLIMVKFPTGIVSYVADTYDFWAVLTIILPYLKKAILRRQANATTPGKLVIRPDSGNPVHIVCGDPDAEPGSPEFKGAIEVLYEIFGGEVTSTGHKLLDSHIGLIYGDSITPVRCLAILEGLEAKGFASGNVVFGVGSYTYQCNTRDTFGFAVKATYSVVNGKPVNIFKDPKTDQKKKSARGLLMVEEGDNGDLILIDQVQPESEQAGLLRTRFKDGVFYNQVTLDEIRARLA